MNVLIPMAGAGTRIVGSGNGKPKPLVDVGGKPMIQVAVESLGVKGKHIFVVREDQDDQFAYKDIISRFVDDFEVVRVSGLTEGAACTALLAESMIDNDEPLLISVCDAHNDLGVDLGSGSMPDASAWDDGVVFCFESNDPRYSYVGESAGYVTRVVEKRVISNKATSGVYYWQHGSYFVRCCRKMIEKGRKVGNEFYLAPVYNEAIEEGGRIRSRMVRDIWDLGTDEKIREYLSR